MPVVIVVALSWFSELSCVKNREEEEAGMDMPACSGHEDAVDLPCQDCIFCFVPSSLIVPQI